VHSEERSRAIAGCERRIEAARAAVFSANDGIVSARMTALEREWRMLSRPDPERGLMDLWARIAPASWIDRKRWRDTPAAARVDAAVALAADVDGVEAAESAVGSLRVSLAAWGAPIGTRVVWRCAEHDATITRSLLAEPLRQASDVVSTTDAARVVFSRADRLARDVEAAILERLPARPQLARDVAHAALVDYVLGAASLPDRPSPIPALSALWRTGYTLAAVDASAVTLELPPL
jgi:hypothetical protein